MKTVFPPNLTLHDPENVLEHYDMGRSPGSASTAKQCPHPCFSSFWWQRIKGGAPIHPCGARDIWDPIGAVIGPYLGRDDANLLLILRLSHLGGMLPKHSHVIIKNEFQFL